VAPIPAETPGQRTDAELIAAHADGDPYAFEELFGRYHRQLARLAVRRTRTPEDAADAMQEAMLAVHNGAARFRRQAAVSTWLHRIVLNKCVDQLRQHDDRFTPRADIDCASTLGVDAGVLTALLVHQALACLPPEQRAAVVAVDMHGYSVGDAARLLEVAEGTVKSRCSRGRARLAVLLAEFRPVRRDAA
jgi:RNA polymerase sigma-70 factor (ECF subfamily)